MSFCFSSKSLSGSQSKLFAVILRLVRRIHHSLPQSKINFLINCAGMTSGGSFAVTTVTNGE